MPISHPSRSASRLFTGLTRSNELNLFTEGARQSLLAKVSRSRSRLRKLSQNREKRRDRKFGKLRFWTYVFVDHAVPEKGVPPGFQVKWRAARMVKLFSRTRIRQPYGRASQHSASRQPWNDLGPATLRSAMTEPLWSARKSQLFSLDATINTLTRVLRKLTVGLARGKTTLLRSSSLSVPKLGLLFQRRRSTLWIGVFLLLGCSKIK